MRRLHEGTFSEGLSTKVLPQAMATGNIHSGTITGKLNGVMPAHTPTGCSSEWQSTPRPTSSACSPFSRCGTPLANSITSMPRCTEPAASSQGLAVLFRGQLREFVAMLLHQFAKAGEDARPAQRRGLAPGRERGPGRRHRGIDSRPVPASGTWRITSPVAGLNTSPMRPPCDGTR